MIKGKNEKNMFEQKTKDNKETYIKIDTNHKNIYMKPKERLYQYPQVINNYDVNVKVNIKKLNDNNINIENMNIAELLGKKLGYNNKRNKSLLDEKNNFFSKTDNNIKFLEPIQNKQNIKKEGLYNNMIQDLKNEFKEIKQKHEMNKENKIINKEKNNKNIRNYLFNENKQDINQETFHNILKKYTWNHKSVNNSFKKNKNINIQSEPKTENLIIDNNIIYNNNYVKLPDNEDINKNKTQNNFYKIPNDNVGLENEKTKIIKQIKNKEKLQKSNIQNLENAIIYMNNKKTKSLKKKSLNLTNNFIHNEMNFNNDNSFINLKEEKDGLNLTLKKNNIIIKKKKSSANIIKNNNVIENYLSSSNNQKAPINKCNSYISKKDIPLFNNTQKLSNEDISVEDDIEIINKNFTRDLVKINTNSKGKNYSKHPKLLYLDKRINKIKNKLIKNEFNNNINHTEIKNYLKIEKNISFSFIKKNLKKVGEISEVNLSIINKIFQVQNNILLELKQNQFILKNELIKKYKEIKNIKNICFKLMIYIRDNLFKKNNNNKIRIIQNQIIKENNILRKLFINKPINIISNNVNNNKKYISDLNEKKIFYNTLNRFKEKNNSELSSDNGRMNTFENKDNDKKRNKSFERINYNYKKDKLNQNINFVNEPSFKYINFREKKNKYIDDNNDLMNRKIGKKIKYLVKDKNNLSLTFENMEPNGKIT